MINKNSVRIEKVQIETPSGEWIWTGTPERVMSHQAFARLTRGADIALGDRATREEMSEGEVVRAELLAGERFFVTATKTAFRVP